MSERLISALELASKLGVSKTHIRWLIDNHLISAPDYVIANGPNLARGWKVESAQRIADTYHPIRRSKRAHPKRRSGGAPV